jgi:peptidoglycan/xylan/chitin deacetylase (PgdA/CDA1 family)
MRSSRSRRIWFTLGCAAISPFCFPGLPSAVRSVAHAAPAKPHTATENAPIRLAITLDDLPGGGPEVAGYTHARMVADIIATLQAHHVRSAAGFVVGSMLEGHPERRAALDQWIEADFDVGNHTYSHHSVSELGLDAYERDIEADEQIVSELERRGGQTERFFRYPYLEEGRTEKERRALGRFLSEHHYTVAKVSIDFEDWAWADARDRCVERGDSDVLDRLERRFLVNADAALEWALVTSRRVFGRSIPQVLLLHANVSTAHNLDALLTAFERRGVQYISLSEALADPAYATDYHIATGNVFWGRRGADHLARPLEPPPFALLDHACREKKVASSHTHSSTAIDSGRSAPTASSQPVRLRRSMTPVAPELMPRRSRSSTRVSRAD